MSQLFKRSVWVEVDGLQIKDLRTTFRVRKTLGKEPNTCEATISNLSQDTRAKMKKKGAAIKLYAGYGGTVKQIFSGDARVITHIHQRPEWTTKIECGDGETAFLVNRISDSFKAGTRWKDVVRAVGKSLVHDTGNLEEKLAPVQDTFMNGYTAHGRSAAELDRLLKGRDLEWSIQDGRLQLLGGLDTNADTITVLSSSTGLVGSPEFGTKSEGGAAKEKHEILKAKSLLQGQIRPGGRVRIESRTINGLFKVSEVIHEGDTAGEQWYSEIEAVAVSR